MVVNDKVYKCKLCGQSVDDGRQKVHFDCMLNKVATEGFDDKSTKWFMNRGYGKREVRELIGEKK